MPSNAKILTISDHSRASAGMTYVYPVVSRRAGGVSVGINLNPNNACNWRCIYCQVPGLTRGGPPPIDLDQLQQELDRLLAWIVHGDFMQTQVPSEARRLMDIAFSGNGEPTSAKEFPAAVAIAAEAIQRHRLEGVALRLITNGSLVERPGVAQGLVALAAAGGEVWFKVDAVTAVGLQRINSTRTTPQAVLRRLAHCAALCPTWVQSCFFALDDQVPAAAEIDAYVQALATLAGKLRGVHLYGIARTSCQPEARRLTPLPAAWFDQLADALARVGIAATVHP